MTDWEPLGWALAVLGTASIVAGAHLTGTTGDVSVLLLTVLGATTAWLALHDKLNESGDERPETESEGSA